MWWPIKMSEKQIKEHNNSCDICKKRYVFLDWMWYKYCYKHRKYWDNQFKYRKISIKNFIINLFTIK